MDGQKDTGAWVDRIEIADAVDVAVILSSSSKVGGKLDPNEFTLLAPDRSNEFDGAVHIARDIYRVANGDR